MFRLLVGRTLQRMRRAPMIVVAIARRVDASTEGDVHRSRGAVEEEVR